MPQPGLPYTQDMPVGLSQEQTAEIMRQRFGLPVPLPSPRAPGSPMPATRNLSQAEFDLLPGDVSVAGPESIVKPGTQPGLPRGGTAPTSPYPIDPATGEALVPPEDQAAGNPLSGQGAPKPLATPQSKAPPASWTPPPASDPVAADIHSKGSYLSQALKDTEVPSWSQPNQFINTIHGDGPMMRHTLGSSDPRYWSAQYPGTPEHEEVQGQLRKRSALAAALRTLPEATKLQEARLHLQGQLAASRSATLDRIVMSPGTADQKLAQINELDKASKLRQAERTGEPGLDGSPAPPGLDAAGDAATRPSTLADREKAYRDAAKGTYQANLQVPDAPAFQKTLDKLSSYTNIQDAIDELSANQSVMNHPESRAIAVKHLMEQGKAGIPNLPQALQHGLAEYARRGQLIPREIKPELIGGSGWSDFDVNGIKMRWRPGTGYDQYEVAQPGGANQFKQSNVPLLSTLFGMQPLVDPITSGQRDAAQQKARTAASLLQEVYNLQNARR